MTTNISSRLKWFGFICNTHPKVSDVHFHCPDEICEYGAKHASLTINDITHVDSFFSSSSGRIIDKPNTTAQAHNQVNDERVCVAEKKPFTRCFQWCVPKLFHSSFLTIWDVLVVLWFEFLRKCSQNLFLTLALWGLVDRLSLPWWWWWNTRQSLSTNTHIYNRKWRSFYLLIVLLQLIIGELGGNESAPKN